MKADDWDRMVNRNDPDIDFLLGQRFAALLLLRKWIDILNPHERDQLATIALSCYEDRLFEDGESFLSMNPAVGEGFRDLCKMFRDAHLE